MTTPSTPSAAVTTLTVHLSSAFLTELTGSAIGQGGTTTQNGVWAYLWNNLPPADVPASPLLPSGSAANFTPLILAGQLCSNVQLGSDGNYNVVVPLTDTANPTVNGGVVYLLVQSEDPSNHHDLVSLIGSTEGNIQPNVELWNYGYAAFEFSLLGQGADQGDLTGIPGFAQHLAVNIDYANNTSSSRGYKISAATLSASLASADAEAVFTYPVAVAPALPFSSLDGTTAMVFSPSNGNFGAANYPASNWSSYLDAFALLTDVVVSGITNGEPDANGIWHNSQYYSYSMSCLTLAAGAWGDAGGYMLFSPNANAQTQGYMLISQTTLQDNLYAAGQGYATLWIDAQLTQPYVIPGSGSNNNQFNPSANNQWGNAFTPLFTGFTAGYWGATAQQANPKNRTSTNNLAGGTLNLDITINQSPAYAFDANRNNAVPTYQHNDAYSQQFFNHSNVYGSAFSDNLSNGLVPGPLIGLSTPGTNTNVSNIDLYAYGSSEIDPYYISPIGANYLPLPTGESDYLIPSQTSNLQLIVAGLSAGCLISPTASIQLGIYLGSGQFDYITLQYSGNIWQNYNVTGAPTTWSISSGGSNVAGTFIINNLPAPSSTTAGQVYWYQLVFSNGSGDQKVFDFYATATATAGQLSTSAASLACDGNASIQSVNATTIQLNLNPAVSMPIGLLAFQYNNQFSAQPAAPVAGTSGGSGFVAVNGQNGTGLPASLDGKVPASAPPSITLTTLEYLQFGWTGTNNGTHTGTATNPIVGTNGVTVGLISEYTNKINAGNLAQINFYDATTSSEWSYYMTAVADLDGQWLTTSSVQLGNGTYQVTMTETLPDGTVFGPASYPLTIVVDIPGGAAAVNAGPSISAIQ